jgi:hypothetical protein
MALIMWFNGRSESDDYDKKDGIDVTRTVRTGHLLLLLLLTIALAMTACSGTGSEADETPNASLEDTAANEPAPAEPEPEPEPAPKALAPLTGLPVDEVVTSRPVAVMINNFGVARPQSGLPHADMVWEVLAEGGITRLIAVFQSDAFDGPIGPIRSIRPYLIELADTYQSIIAHAGASNDAYAILQRQDKPYLDEISNAGSYFRRDKSRKAPHNLYSDLKSLREGAEKKGYKTTTVHGGYPFMETAVPPIGGTDATKIEIKFMLDNYKVSYVYDSVTQAYSRSINDKPHTDLTSGEQLKATNLVVLGTRHKVLDNEGRMEVDLTSGGPAVLYQLGKAVDAEWVRSADDVIRIMKDGSELKFAPGKTFYHIVPSDPTFAEHLLVQ